MNDRENAYDKRYAETDNYWGDEPTSLSQKLIDQLKSDDKNPAELTLLDIGCGEGRDSIFFARHGLKVTALDLSPVGLEKTATRAAKLGLEIEIIEDDIASFKLDKQFDLVLSAGSAQYIPEDKRKDRFDYFKSLTRPCGYHAIIALVQKPFIPDPPDSEKGIVLLKSGDLLSYYWDWEIIYSIETIFDCNSGGVLHRHGVNRVIAQKR